MAEIIIEGENLVLKLSKLEAIASVHGDVAVPLSSLRSVEVLDDAHEPADHGFKVGERLPGHSEMGRVFSEGKRLFVEVHHSTPRGLRITFADAGFDEWIVGVTDPESMAETLRAHLTH
jgi:hypothetical protein